MVKDSGKRASFRTQLIELTKSQLYALAQAVGIAGRSRLSKNELVDSLNKRKKEIEPLLETSAKAPKAKAVKKTPSSNLSSKKETMMKENAKQSVESPLQTATHDVATSMAASAPPPAPATEPDQIWHGEQGPDLPHHYGRTLIQAMPRDPNWIYLYWEIADDTKNAIKQAEGEWIFEVSTSLIRVLDKDGNVAQEVPILLDAMSWYLCLASSRDYRFEIGLKHDDRFILIARSNIISLSSARPSDMMDEEWAMLEDRFSEMLLSAATGGAMGSISSKDVLPHLFRHRINLPWNISFPHQVPSSHSFGGASGMMSSRSLGSHSVGSSSMKKK